MGRGPSSGVAFPSPIAIEWVLDQILCKGLLVGLAEGLPALCIGLLPLLCLEGQTKFSTSSVCRGPLLFARFGQQSKCGIYLLTSSLSSIVKFFITVRILCSLLFYNTINLCFHCPVSKELTPCWKSLLQ